MAYIKLRKALFSTLQVALIFWKLLSDTLIDWGFKLNEYNKCLAIKIINGKQSTIIWHMDDLKISHVDKNILEDNINMLNNKFGQESPQVTARGKVL